MITYQQKTFITAANSSGGEADSGTVFHYRQQGVIVCADYHGGGVVKGHLIGLVDEKGVIDMRYHHVNTKGEIKTGVCISTPELLPNGKMRLHEKWQWTCGDNSKGESVLEEV